MYSVSGRRPLMHEVRHAYQLFTAPSVEPVSLQDLKSYCRIDGGDEDGWVDSIAVPAARKRVEADCDRSLLTQVWKLYLDEFPECIDLRKCPVQSVSSITYPDPGDGSTLTLSSSDYRVDAVSEPARVTPAFGTYWPAIRCQTNAVCVTFTAGYGAEAGDVDETARQAVLMAVARAYADREGNWKDAADYEQTYMRLIDRLRYDY